MKKEYKRPVIEKIYGESLLANVTPSSLGIQSEIPGGESGGQEHRWEFGGDGNSGDDPDAKWNDGWDMWK